jgi:hypothetical protein
MKYMLLWEMDMSKFPADPVENGKIMAKLIGITKQWGQSHPSGEWGKFLGENRGYSIASSQDEVMQASMMFSPYVQFKVYQIVSLEEVEASFKAMMAMMPGK